jgi:hypothetical protein
VYSNWVRKEMPDLATGALNPTWVEWLMHWPLNWTSLEPLKNEQFDKWAQDGAAVVRGERVQTVWFNAEPTQAPQGPRSVQQRADERGDSLCAVPCGGTQEAEACGVQSVRQAVSAEACKASNGLQPDMLSIAGQDVGAETLVPRVATGVMARVDRLKAIGNGQVPLCAATAWQLLTKEL